MEAHSASQRDAQDREYTTDRLAFWGWITTLLVWPVGVVFAILLLVRKETTRGVWMLVVCVIAAIISFVLIGPAIDSEIGGMENAEMERVIERDLASQLPGSDLESVDCVGAGESHSRCITTVDGQTVGMNVATDSDTGEFIWQVAP